jgi:glycosyltransferase involved in cell wall biosynthesis
MERRFKVLVAAYACNPVRGSEEGVGWGWVKALARTHDLYVITAEFHRAEIEEARARNSELFRHTSFHYVPHKPWHYTPKRAWLAIENSILKPLMNYAYHLWQRDAYELGRELHGRIHFDLVHQLTYVGFRFPGHLWKLDPPFVWGPIGGLENTPWRLLPALGLNGYVYYACRNIRNSFHKRYLPAPKRAFRKAQGNIIAATEGNRREIRRWFGEGSVVIAETGPPSDLVPGHSARKAGEPIRLAWSGLHLPGKALPLLLRALKRIPARIPWQLDILGQGPCTEKWRRLSWKLGIGDRCKWYGQVERSRAIAVMREAHVFVITSLKDLTSTVLLEALSQGLPVVCPDHCGFSNAVTAGCGIKVPVGSPRQLSVDIARGIERLAEDEERRRCLALGALERARDFSWDKKAEQVDLIYRRAVSDGAFRNSC